MYEVPRTIDACMLCDGTSFPMDSWQNFPSSTHSTFIPSLNWTLLRFLLFFFVLTSYSIYLSPLISLPVPLSLSSPSPLLSSLSFSSLPFLTSALFLCLPISLSCFSLLTLPPLHRLLLPLCPFCQVFSYWHCLYHCWQTSGSGKLCDASGGNWTLLCHCSCWAGCSWVHSPSPHLPLSHTPKSTQDSPCCTAGSANCIWNLVKVCGWSGAGSHDS